MKTDHKFLNGVWKLIRNSETGYDYLFKNNRLLFSRTIDYCFPIVYVMFCNLIIPKQGIEMQILFLNGLWRFLKNGHLPDKLHSSAPRVWLIQLGFRNYFILKHYRFLTTSMLLGLLRPYISHLK